MPHSLNRADVDLAAFTRELSDRLGRTVAVSARLPGQFDESGKPLPGVLLVIDPATGAEVDVDGRTVNGAVTSHRPPPTAAERRTQALDAAERKAAAGDTAGALADVLRMMRAN